MSCWTLLINPCFKSDRKVSVDKTVDSTDSTARKSSLWEQQHLRRYALAKLFHHVLYAWASLLLWPAYRGSLNQIPPLSSRERYVVHCRWARWWRSHYTKTYISSLIPPNLGNLCFWQCLEYFDPISIPTWNRWRISFFFILGKLTGS